MATTGAAVLSTCGCCEGSGPVTPLTVFNRPSLTAVGYRVGDYAAFRQAMIQAIPRVGAELADQLGLPTSPLTAWTTRQPDDLGIAVLDLWAVVGDILTFYQERIANEAYLRTAVHRDSIRRLAAMLDYRLHPGVAADTLLAFTLEPAATVQVPVGLRAQSVPSQGQTPQTFETVEAITARDVLNEVRVFPQPVVDNPLRPKGTSGMLTATSAVPTPGDRLILFSEPTASFRVPEEKVVEAVEEVDGRTVLTWSPPIQRTGWSTAIPRPGGSSTPATASLFTYSRTFRVFGADAPPTFLEPIKPAAGSPASVPPVIGWRYVETTFDLDSATELPLDALYDDLKVATNVLVRTPSGTLRTTIEKVEQGQQQQGPLTGNVTVLTLKDKVFLPPNVVDRREVLVYELADEPILLRSWAVADNILLGTSTVYVDAALLPSVEAGQPVLLDDSAGEPQVMAVAADGALFRAPVESEADFLKIQLSAELHRDLDTSTARLLGNLARATHGETVAPERVGSGDGSLAFQTFALAKQPLTHVRSAAAPAGAQSTLSLRVDQIEWQEVRSLVGQPPAARVYTTDIEDNGSTSIRFGDGVTGARPATGRDNLTATYRQGLGLAGNLDPGKITTALDRPPGLKSVTNPVRSTGGTDPETTDLARLNAPNTVRVFDRAISVFDFADLARGFAGVTKAQATSVWDGEAQTVHLTVAGPSGAVLADRDLDDLGEYLNLRRDPNRALLVDNYQRIAVTVTAVIQVDRAYINPVVETAVRAALEHLLSFETRRFSEALHLSDVYAALQNVAGVVSVDVDVLGYEDPVVATSHGATSDPVQAHLPINAAKANPSPPPKILAAELAFANPAAIHVKAVGGLPS